MRRRSRSLIVGSGHNREERGELARLVLVQSGRLGEIIEPVSLALGISSAMSRTDSVVTTHSIVVGPGSAARCQGLFHFQTTPLPDWARRCRPVLDDSRPASAASAHASTGGSR